MPDSPAQAPRLETDRLVLRAHRLEDFEDSLAMWSDEGVTRFIGGKPSPPEEVWSRLMRYAGHWALQGFGYWVVQEKASGRFLGEAGFFNLRRDIDPPFGDAPEAGWALTPSAQGRGLATEAMTRILAWGDLHFGPVRMVCMISPENAPSFRVAEKLGYREYARSAYKGAPTVLLERRG